MKHKHAPTNRNQRLAHLQCELCEAGHAIAKINRWGAHSKNPEGPDDPILNPPNIGELLLELWDVEYAINQLMPDIVQFLRADYVQRLREHWVATALPPPPPTEPAREFVVVKCPECGGLGRRRTQIDAKRTTMETCQTCNGLGEVRTSPGENEETKPE